MNISSAQTRSLTEITAAFDESGVGADKEVRAKGGGKVLYEKTKAEGRFSTKASRANKQDSARKLIGSALKKELESHPGAKVFEGVVRKNMRDIFEGNGVVTKGDFDRVKAESDRVVSTYESYKTAKEKFAKDSDCEAGRKDMRNVLRDTPGFSPDMEFFDVVELYSELLNSPKPLTSEIKKLLGALGAFAKDKGSDISDVAAHGRASEAVHSAVSHGATSVKALPQIVLLRQIGTLEDQKGRCAPLVALTALAESSGPTGSDGLMRRLEQEVHDMQKAGLREPNEYASQLAQLHGPTGNTRERIKAPDGSKIETFGHRTTVKHLEDTFKQGAGKPVMYGVEVTGHIMMIGATRHEGKDSYIFYDPNFGTARFDSARDMNKFLDQYFGELGYGKEYRMDDLGRGEFEFNVAKQYDLDKVAALTVKGGGVDVMLEPK